ncbi:hypothetical protein BSK66_07060 [Paenibacillus odorifer]|uniref:Uncharacterized protein n=1 Tax=Paenibacillus odorifer TaxID=189426 RepID=A0A1R0WUC1_9BACL|nr:hypothetical protein PODO_14535 [Paenibacillus odorifer]OMD21492.1 hypothetical protein BJP51_07660 [Paenibacillus odorifer]OME44535.1 hypothetical protein BSK58_03550 [Paenibacillus odorifer]OME59076.1 hypothetical protein BSK59_07995 [Paenibacillus odorifer]OME62119.1 hypothetical protein BSK66_07060 [Paenibacillus odorifer]
MFVLIMEIMKTAIQFLTDLLSGNLPKYFYLWCGLFMLFVIIYAYLEVRMKYKSVDFIKGICIESVSHLAGWIIGILVTLCSYIIHPQWCFCVTVQDFSERWNHCLRRQF